MTKFGEQGFYYKGNKTGILLIHGITGTPAEMKLVAKTFFSQGFSVLCPQLQGHCGTHRELKKSTWVGWYGTVADSYEFLKRECDLIFFVGLSLGGLLGLQLCLEKEGKITGCILFSPTFFFDGWNMSPMKQFLSSAIIHSPLRHIWNFYEGPPYGIKDEVTRSMLIKVLSSHKDSAKQVGHMKVPALTMYQGFCLIESTKKVLGKIKTPILIIQSLEDDISSTKNVKFLEDHLGSEVIQVHYLNDSYHVITVDKQREEVAAKTIEFITHISESK